MTVKVKLIYPRIEFDTKITEIEIKEDLSQNQIIDYVFEHKKSILKDGGCQLDDHEITSAIALGAANIKIIK